MCFGRLTGFGGGLSSRQDRWELHVSAGDRMVARLAAPVVPVIDGGDLGDTPEVLYLHQAFGPGPSLLTDELGELVEERFYEPFGTLLAS